MEKQLHIDYQCIDAKTPPNSWQGWFKKNGYEGFKPTIRGRQKKNELHINNGQRSNATHIAMEPYSVYNPFYRGEHAVLQQAGPDINLVNELGSAFIDNSTGKVTQIGHEETAENLRAALDEIKDVSVKSARGRGTTVKRVLMNVLGHKLCGDIASHASGTLDINRDGIVTPQEYMQGENKLRANVRKKQEAALEAILTDVFDQGKNKIPFEIKFGPLQNKYSWQQQKQWAFVNKAVGK